MIAGFHKHLVDNGWKRTINTVLTKRKDEENYTDMTVSSYGPVHYKYSKDGVNIYWGLYEAGMPPRWEFDPHRKASGMTNEELEKIMLRGDMTCIVDGIEHYADGKGYPDGQKLDQ